MAGVAAVQALKNSDVNLLLGTSVSFDLTSVASASGGSTIYTGVFTGGGSDAYANLNFLVQNTLDSRNSGNFPSSASTATTLTLTNTQGVAEEFGGQAIYVLGESDTGAGPTCAVPANPLGGRYSNFTWSTATAGGPGSLSVSIEGSNDGVDWQIIDTTTATGGESRYVGFNPFQFLRAYVTTLDTGTVVVYLTFGN